MHPYPRLALIAIATVALCALMSPAMAQDADGDGIPDDVEVRLGTRPTEADVLIPVGESPAKDTSPDLRKFSMCHIAQNRYLWKIEYAEDFPKTGDTMVMYVDADHDLKTGRQDKPEVIGTDVQYSPSGASVANKKIYESGQTGARGRIVGNVVWICDDVLLKRDGGNATIRMRLLVQRKGASDGTDWFEVSIPVFEGRELPEVPGLDTLMNKGMERADVEPGPGDRDNLPERRDMPAVPFASEGRAPAKGATVARATTALGLVEEAGMARDDELVSVGVPFAEGVIFDPAMIRVLDGAGGEAIAQVTVTSFWADDSIRWALVDFVADVGANEEVSYAVEYGSEVARAAVPNPVVIDDTGVALIVSTGPLQATVSKTRGTFLTNVQTEAAPIAGLNDGLMLVGETGTVFTTANATPEVRIEKQGPLTATVRVEMPYISDAGDEYMRAIVRLSFVAGSPTVGVDATHVNDYIETEFTDIRSLTMPIELAAQPELARFVESSDIGPMISDRGLGAQARVVQKTDALASVGGEEHADLRLPGAMDYFSNAGTGVGVAVLDFWQEYPKALSANGERALVEILPSLEGEDFYEDLPDNLKFPFVEGCYRMKWGMAKTTRMSLDFQGRQADSRIPWQYATLQHPLLPVISSEVYAATGALGTMAAVREGRFAAWDADIAKRFDEHLAYKEKEREYGFFNWGDWFGERGRNWGNNEYDFPHGLFMQFARTGERRYFRLAQASARHQADVDCVHAYPDIMNLGAMAPHSVCHTGEWSQNLAVPQWSYRYGGMTTAANGHTWADGMVDAYYLTGDARVMEVAIGLGEHIAYAMAPSFDHLGTHERSAGWSLNAVMALYRATGDPIYLAAAKKIVGVALAEQDLENTGTWPHVLPNDHAAGYPGAVGNVGFLIGVLMSGMADYHQATGDPEVLASMQAGCRWLTDVMWIPKRWHFHYTSSPGYLNNPQKSSSGCTMLTIPPMAYTAHATGDDEMMDIVGLAFAGLLRDTGSGWGKSFAQALFFAPDIMGALDEADASREAVHVALTLDPVVLRNEQYKTAPWATALGIRGPVEKTVHLLREGDEAFVVTALRTPYGARTREMERGKIEVVGPDGAVLKQGDFDTNDEYEFEVDLGADAPEGVYIVRVTDDMRAVWDVNSSEGKRVIELVGGLSLGGVGTTRWALYAPPGVSEFTLRVVDWHRGKFGALVLTPDGEVVAVEDTNQTENTETEQVLEVNIGANPDGRVVPLVLYTRMDINVAVEGIPPYLAPSAEAWFNPADY